MKNCCIAPNVSSIKELHLTANTEYRTEGKALFQTLGSPHEQAQHGLCVHKANSQAGHTAMK